MVESLSGLRRNGIHRAPSRPNLLMGSRLKTEISKLDLFILSMACLVPSVDRDDDAGEIT